MNDLYKLMLEYNNQICIQTQKKEDVLELPSHSEGGSCCAALECLHAAKWSLQLKVTNCYMDISL